MCNARMQLSVRSPTSYELLVVVLFYGGVQQSVHLPGCCDSFFLVDMSNRRSFVELAISGLLTMRAITT